MDRVKGKVALVTGGAMGLGEASVRALHSEGASVVVADINRAAGEALVQELGDRALFIELDVSQESAWQAAIEQTLNHFGGLHVLVNNAGVVVVASIEETTAEQLRFIQGINFDGPFWGCKHALPAMADCGGGSIINMSSAASIKGTPAFAAYSATKGAVRSLTQTVAAHCKSVGNGVRCNSIHPGGMNTPMVESLPELGKNSPQAMEMMLAQMQPEDTAGEPNDVAAAVVYLAADESSYVSGAQLSIDNAFTVT